MAINITLARYMAMTGKPYAHLYNSRLWRGTPKNGYRDGLRWAALVKDGFQCRMCGKVDGKTSRLVADHIQKHDGNEELFFDIENIQCLCKSPCHDMHKQKQEKSGKSPWSIDDDGWPIYKK